ncbi:MAG: hypothetical protein ABIZ52_08005 [Candidatus Limnocylindrales bacterium]
MRRTSTVGIVLLGVTAALLGCSNAAVPRASPVPTVPSTAPTTVVATATVAPAATPGAVKPLKTGSATLTGSWSRDTTTGPKPLAGKWTGPIIAERSRALPNGSVEAEWADGKGGYLLVHLRDGTAGTRQTTLGDAAAAVIVNFIVNSDSAVPITLNESTGPGQCTTVVERTPAGGMSGTTKCIGTDSDGSAWSLTATYSGEP